MIYLSLLLEQLSLHVIIIFIIISNGIILNESQEELLESMDNDPEVYQDELQKPVAAILDRLKINIHPLPYIFQLLSLITLLFLVGGCGFCDAISMNGSVSFKVIVGIRVLLLIVVDGNVIVVRLR